MSVLEKIRADLEHWKSDGTQDDFESGAMYMRDYALMVIEKYASEECDRDCEHCVYIECRKDGERMTIEEINILQNIVDIYEKEDMYPLLKDKEIHTIKLAIKALKQEPCEDAVSRQAVIDIIEFEDKWLLDAKGHNKDTEIAFSGIKTKITNLPSVQPKAKQGRCKDCKYFEYDSVAKVDGIPLIVAHEICSKWGDGCKTKEDGYCFMYEPQESENKK